MRLAVNDQKDQPPLFIDLATFGSSAEACAKYLTKGRAIAVTGRLVYREWLSDDGARRSKHPVAGRVQFGARPENRRQRRHRRGGRILNSQRPQAVTPAGGLAAPSTNTPRTGTSTCLLNGRFQVNPTHRQAGPRPQTPPHARYRGATDAISTHRSGPNSGPNASRAIPAITGHDPPATP